MLNKFYNTFLVKVVVAGNPIGAVKGRHTTMTMCLACYNRYGKGSSHNNVYVHPSQQLVRNL